MEAHIKEIHQIFKDYFDEENVDFIPTDGGRPSCLLVRFPEITVTNEDGLSTKIYDLFCRVFINEAGGLLRMQFRRTTFTAEQFNSGYIHSHLPPSSYAWSAYCWGKGPMATIIADLKEFNSILWEQFCMTLATTLPIESLAGGPYIRIENLGQRADKRFESYMNIYAGCIKRISEGSAVVVKAFMEYLLNKDFFDPYLQVYGDEVYFNIPITDLAVYLSKEWEEFFMDNDFSGDIYEKYLVPCVYGNNFILSVDKNTKVNIPSMENCKVEFKGKTFAFTLLDIENLNIQKKVLAPKIVYIIVNALMTVLYGY